jgi:LacI family transcriptional regulator
MTPDCDVVTIDSSGTLEKVTDLLLQYGHRQIALLTMHHPLPVYRHMEQGIRRVFARAGVPRHGLRVLQLDYGRHGNLKPAEFGGRLIEGLQKSPACTALIAADLWRAIPATYALRDAGFRIPEDISMISVFDSEYFPALHPPVTATTIYAQTIAERAVERLLKKIEDPHNSPCHERVPGELIERASVGPPRTGEKRFACGE